MDVVQFYPVNPVILSKIVCNALYIMLALCVPAYLGEFF